MKFILDIKNKVIKYFTDLKLKRDIRNISREIKLEFSNEELLLIDILIDNLTVALLTDHKNSKYSNFIKQVSVETIKKILRLSKIVALRPMCGPRDSVLRLITNKGLNLDTVSLSAKSRMFSTKMEKTVLDSSMLGKSQVLVDELVNNTSSKLAIEIFNEFFDDIEMYSNKVNIENKPTSYSVNNIEQIILNEADNIALRSGRGKANFIICGVDTITFLSKLENSKFTKEDMSSLNKSLIPQGLNYIGELDGVELYCYPLLVDKVILGYCDQMQIRSVDAGIIFAPYKLVSMMQTVDIHSGEYEFNFCTLFDKIVNPEDVSKYYTTINIKIPN